MPSALEKLSRRANQDWAKMTRFISILWSPCVLSQGCSGPGQNRQTQAFSSIQLGGSSC